MTAFDGGERTGIVYHLTNHRLNRKIADRDVVILQLMIGEFVGIQLSRLNQLSAWTLILTGG